MKLKLKNLNYWPNWQIVFFFKFRVMLISSQAGEVQGCRRERLISGCGSVASSDLIKII